ncbi:MAG: DUF2155 domain-containing protein [Sphingomonas sp.]
MISRLRTATAAALLLGLGACGGDDAASVGNNQSIDDIVTTDGGDVTNVAPSADVTEVAPDGTEAAAATPMKDRIATIGLLNKRNGQERELKLKPGQAVRVGDTIVRLRACEKTAPWENFQDQGAFVQLDVQQPDRTWRRVFSGWLYAARPALNVVQHPIYDVWAKSCTMTFRDSGPNTVSAGEGAKGSSSAKKASSAEKSPSAEPAPAATPAASPSAAPSNPT